MEDIPIDQMDIRRLRAELTSALTANRILIERESDWGRAQTFHYCVKGIAPYSRLFCSVCPPTVPMDGSMDFNAYEKVKELKDEKLELLEENRNLRKANLSFAPNQIKLRAENKRLEKKEHLLDALEAAGVDNWEGYDEAMIILREMRGE